ncbi:class I SAM-dependent methyltransferase [Aureimonas pseudogalii]|uniref:Phosphatidylethanolamine/phosphatidyl-N-methylethanolamine N-methyltransferase n=1 Tax=Aureimonas pseudogalii TaxID=1744844 RepID=A0A7W6EBC3_9HYPH|nr:phospholipid methyltransferase [Aureimonas pseudogalii]MBB3997719.1 phosphatidylethanolamine/phosphatidyl-N-methylethanolamine N-methyltransferase [Aureimonas pseudogalii]
MTRVNTSRNPNREAALQEISHKGGRDAGKGRFLREWLRSPLGVGALSPSSAALGTLMASFVPDDPDALVIELGPGTGAVTRCLLQRGIAAERLACVEYAPEFCGLLRLRYPGICIVQGDAYTPPAALLGWIDGRRIAAVVSSLPLMARPEAERSRALDRYLALLPPGAPFIQFTYSPSLPVKPDAVGATAFPSRWIKRNLPPARVVVYRREGAAFPSAGNDDAEPRPSSA